MSTIKTKKVQVGTDSTASNNFTIYTPGTPDGTVRIGNGNADSPTDRVTVTSAGNVGIGTSSPGVKLDVTTSTTDNGIRISDGTVSTLFVNSSSSYATLGTSSNHALTFWSNNTERMRIDSSGRVTMPYQPTFSVVDLTYTGSSNVDGVGGAIISNVGSFYNSTNGRFTAPINGNYLFYGTIQYYDSGSTTYVELKFLKNGSQIGTGIPSGGNGIYNNHLSVSGTVIISLNANDYVNIRASYGSRDLQNYFGGYLIG